MRQPARQWVERSQIMPPSSLMSRIASFVASFVASFSRHASQRTAP